MYSVCLRSKSKHNCVAELFLGGCSKKWLGTDDLI